MPSSNYLRGKLIDLSLRQVAFTAPVGVYVGLHTADPTVSVSAGTEVVAAWYSRQAVTFAAQSTPGVTSNTNTITFSSVTGSTVIVTHFALYDAATIGNGLFYAPLSVAKTFNVSDVPSWLVGALSVTCV